MSRECQMVLQMATANANPQHRTPAFVTRPANARWLLRMRIRSTAPPRCHTRGLPSARKVLAPARPARDSPGVRVRQEIARQPARGVGREAGVGRVVAALREVPAQAGLEDCAGVVLVVALFVGAAAGQVIRPDELQHVGGERVERDHGGWTGGELLESLLRLLRLLRYGQT